MRYCPPPDRRDKQHAFGIEWLVIPARALILPMDLILEADRLGYHSVWTSEAYGSDCITPLAWIGALTQNVKLGTAIMQMPARSPAMTAMTAITLDQLSGGRALLGLGLSGPAGGGGLARTRPTASLWLRRVSMWRLCGRFWRARRLLSMRANIIRFPTRAMTRPDWASRSRASFTAAPICRSTWRRLGRKMLH